MLLLSLKALHKPATTVARFGYLDGLLQRAADAFKQILLWKNRWQRRSHRSFWQIQISVIAAQWRWTSRWNYSSTTVSLDYQRICQLISTSYLSEQVVTI